MGIFDGKATNLTQTSTNKYSPQGEELFASIFPKVKQFADTPLQQFGGSGVVGFNPNEVAGQNTLLGAAGTQGDLASRSAAAHSLLLDPNFMLGDNQHLQAMRGAITGNVTDDFLQRILPAVRSGNIASSGMYSGGATKAGLAEAGSTGLAGKELSRALTELMFNAYNRGLGGMQQAVGQTGQVMNQQLQPGLTQAAVGEQQRAMEQRMRDEEISRFYTGQMLPFLQAQELQAFLQGMPMTNVSTVKGKGGSPSLFQQAIGGIAAGAAAAAKGA